MKESIYVATVYIKRHRISERTRGNMSDADELRLPMTWGTSKSVGVPEVLRHASVSTDTHTGLASITASGRSVCPLVHCQPSTAVADDEQVRGLSSLGERISRLTHTLDLRAK